jgi:hypothetical protein
MPFDPTLLRVVDRVRLSLADTDDTQEWLADETYEAMLTAGGASLTEVDTFTEAVGRTLAGVIEGLIRRSPVKRTANGEVTDYTGQADFYHRIATGETDLPLLEVPGDTAETDISTLTFVPVIYRDTSSTDEYSR